MEVLVLLMEQMDPRCLMEKGREQLPAHLENHREPYMQEEVVEVLLAVVVEASEAQGVPEEEAREEAHMKQD